MSAEGVLAKIMISKIFSALGKYSYTELRKKETFFQILKDLGIEYPKNDFDSLYFHTVFLFARESKYQELIILLKLEDSKNAFKQEIKNRHKGAFKQSLDQSLHTNRQIREIKKWNEIPQKYIDKFLSIYEDLVAEVTNPVETKFLNNLHKTSESIDKVSEQQALQTRTLSKAIDHLIHSNSKEESKLQKEYERQILAINNNFFEKNRVKVALEQLLGLKQAIWDEANNTIKFKVLTNIGVCYNSLGDNINAADNIIKAFEFDPGSEAAHNNIINAYISTGNLDNARSYLQKYLTKYPNSTGAYSNFIRLKSEEESFEEIRQEIPSSIVEDEKILFAFSVLARKRKKYDSAIEYIRNAICKNPANIIFEEYLLDTILEKHSANFKVINLGQIDLATKGEMSEALILIDKYIEFYKTSDLENVKFRLFFNKSFILQLLGENDKAIIEIDKALRIRNNDYECLKNKALYLLSSEQINKAIEVLETVKDRPELSEGNLLLAELYSLDGRKNEAIEVLEGFTPTKFNKEFNDRRIELLLIIFIEQNEVEKIRNLVDTTLELSSIRGLLSKANALMFLGEIDEPARIIKQLKSLSRSDESLSQKDIFILAEGFSELEEHHFAIELFEKIINTQLDNKLTTRLAQLYYNIGEKAKCLNIFQDLRKNYGVLSHITPNEISIYQEYGDYERAKLVAEEYVKCFPEDFSMQLRLSAINFRLEDYDAIDHFLGEEWNIFELNFEELKVYLGQLMTRTPFRLKGLRIAYKYRRKARNHRASILYVEIISLFQVAEDELGKSISVNSDSTVKLLNNSGKSITITIEEYSFGESKEWEINTKDSSYLNLKDKVVGDFVKFENSDTKWEIIEITNKYFDAFRESIALCETIEGDGNPFFFGNIKDVAGYLERFNTSESSWGEKYNSASSLYRARRIPLGTIASSFKKNPILLWEEYHQQNTIGIQAALGTTKSWEDTFNILEQKTSLCADITSLLTIFELNLASCILACFGKLKIATSTLNLLYSLQLQEGPFRAEIYSNTSNKIERFKEFTKKIIEDFVPDSKYQLNSVEKTKLDNIYGESFVDTFLIAKDLMLPILSDDLIFRNLTKNEYGIQGTWTQAIMKFMMNKGYLSESEYYNKVIQLMQLNYHHTSIDSNILRFAADASNHQYLPPFSNSLTHLIGSISSENSSILVAFDLLSQIWSDNLIQNKNKEELTLNVITSLCTERSILPVLDKLSYLAKINSVKDGQFSDLWKVYYWIDREISKFKKYYAIN